MDRHHNTDTAGAGLFCSQAAVSPGFVAMTSLWYKKEERESRVSPGSLLARTETASQRPLVWGFGTEPPG